MATPAEQYRALVARLEAIQSLSEADINPETGDQYTSVANAPLQEPPGADTGGAAKPAGGIETIDAPTFKQAYAQAKSKGLKQFKWCGTYAVQDAAKKGGAAKPAATPTPIPGRRQFGGQNPGLELGPLSGSDLPISA
jgi:hypothetical protein